MATRCLVSRGQTFLRTRIPPPARVDTLLGCYSRAVARRLRPARQGQLYRGYSPAILSYPSSNLSRAGNKRNDITIIYTPSDNLKVR